MLLRHVRVKDIVKQCEHPELYSCCFIIKFVDFLKQDSSGWLFVVVCLLPFVPGGSVNETGHLLMEFRDIILGNIPNDDIVYLKVLMNYVPSPSSKSFPGEAV